MTDQTGAMTVEILDAFAAAFNEHDVAKVMSFMTDDCIFEASSGDEACGASIRGKEAVAAAFTQVLDAFPDARWSDGEHFVMGDRGLSHWTFTGTLADGKRVEVQGCDVFTFRGDKIYIKNSYP